MCWTFVPNEETYSCELQMSSLSRLDRLDRVSASLPAHHRCRRATTCREPRVVYRRVVYRLQHGATPLFSVGTQMLALDKASKGSVETEA